MEFHARMGSLALLVMLALLGGCGGEAGGGAVAVVDLETVAAAVGHEARTRAKLEAGDRQIAAQLATVAEVLQTQLEAVRDALTGETSDEARREFETVRDRTEQRLRVIRDLARGEAAAFATALEAEFRDDVGAVAAAVAERQGVRVVVASGSDVLSADQRLDITDPLVTELRERGFEAPPATAAAGGDAAHAAAPSGSAAPSAEGH